MARSTGSAARSGNRPPVPPDRRRGQRPVAVDRRKSDEDIAERMSTGVRVKKRDPKKNSDN